ncbi:hypothetical protein N7E81_02830 [Reichenbachiella carrageenanivorans]|uniref:Uncharacterized protein n=1 Tax=Reichenbachiella carrageenanivorans TaxID=2979869 RepID=A0ABY6D1J5_9BACT|nr:hypothetical protein [Reichenbachiella carrageenanivorans]UXX80039.1 hypothetical protein N7E81_02830 [Reichenbachiella carrageenanivorans]
MSTKVKSELSFIFKLSLLFLILFASKVNRSSDIFASTKEALIPADNISVITTSIRE